MTRFEIRTDSFEFRGGNRPFPSMSAQEILETYLSCDTSITSNDLNPQVEESYDTLEAARAAFHARTGFFSWADYGATRQEKDHGLYFLRGRLAWIEESIYDEDGEFDQGGDVYDISAAGWSNDNEED